MANRFTTNFAFFTSLPGTFTLNSGGSITGSKMRFSGAGIQYAQITLDNQATWIVNMRVNIASVNGTTAILNFMDGSSFQFTLGIKTTGKLACFRGSSSGTQVGSDSINALTFDSDSTYYDIEIKLVIHDTTGSVEVRVNGNTTPEISATNVDTKATSNTSADNIRFGQDGGVGGTVSMDIRYQHCIVMDASGSVMNNFLGPRNVNVHTPTADGNYTTWTANTGTRFGAVDDSAPNGDTDYVSAPNVGDKVSFVMSNLPAGVTTVNSIVGWTSAKRDDATSRAFKLLLRSSGSDQLGTVEHFVGSSYAYFMDVFDQSPFTSSPWGTSEVDGLEAGAQVTT